jgi:hypothetical protein
MKNRFALVFPMMLALGACSTFTTPRYSINADTNVALKSLQASNIAVGSFSGPAVFDNSCRAAGPLAPPDGMTYTTYIAKALEDELKVAGIYAATSPKFTLTGEVKKLDFSSSRGLTGGSWDIDVIINSSNGKSMSMSEHYEFESGFIADTACKQTAEAYMPAVQDLINKIVLSPLFKPLLQ